MSERVVWGIDIGQTGLRAVKLEKVKGGAVHFLDSFFCPIDSQPDDPEHDDKVKDALVEFAQTKNVGQTPVVLSLPGYTTLFRSFPVPSVAPGKLREVVSYEAKQLVPYPLEEVQWDFQQLGYNEETDEIQIALLCCRSDIINNILQMADEAELLVEDIQVGSIALVNFCLHDCPPEGSAMLLDCGARSTDFVMFDEESFWLRPIAICGDDVSRGLMKKFNISFEEAEQLKSNMSDAKQAARVFNVCEPIIRNLASEAQRSFGFYRSTNRGAKVDELILAGNTFLMEGADQYMADHLGYGARTIDIPQSMALSANVDSEELVENRQIYGIATGLALQGLGLSRFACSLLPEARKFRKLLKRKEKYGWAAVAVIAISALLNLGLIKSNKPRFERDLKDIRGIMAQANKRKREYDSKMKKFEPQLKKNRRMLEVENGRGWISAASDLLYSQIERLNNERFKKVNPRPVSNLTQDKIIANLEGNIMGWPSSKRTYDALLKTASDEFKVDAQTDEETKLDMQKNLKMQVLRRVSMIQNRIKRTFITDFQAYKTKGTLSKDGTEEVWQITELDGTGKDSKPTGIVPGNMPPPMGARGGRNAPPQPDMSAMAASDAEKDVLLLTITGFTVTQDGDDMRVLRDRLDSLKVLGLYLYEKPDAPGFKIIRDAKTDTNNTINLPKIYDPTPKKANFDEIGEGGNIDRSEKIEYEPFDKEKIYKFSAKLVYAPTEQEVSADELEALVAAATATKKTAPEAEKETTAPAKDEQKQEESAK